MKLKLSLFLCVSLFSQILLAQETHVIEPSVLEVTYKTDCKFTLIRASNGALSTLRCGKNNSQFFYQDKLWYDSLTYSSNKTLQEIAFKSLFEPYEHPNDPSKLRPNCPGITDWLYTNTSQKKVSSYVSIMGIHYKIEEDIPQFGWTLHNDTTRNIIGYDCQMATAKFRGRDWTVWFAPDIAISLGPWKFGGLPGLILSAECKDFVDITATEIKTKDLTPVTFYNFGNYNFEKIDRVKYLKAKTNPQSYPKGIIMTPEMELE